MMMLRQSTNSDAVIRRVNNFIDANRAPLTGKNA